MTNRVIPLHDDTLVEIFAAQREFLVAVNESGVPMDEEAAEYGGTIYWNGPTYAEAQKVARELQDASAARSSILQQQPTRPPYGPPNWRAASA